MRRLSFALAIIGTIFFSGCALNQMVKMAKDQDLKVTPNPLELHGSNVDLEVSATLPVKMLKKNLVYASMLDMSMKVSHMILKELNS